MKKFISIMLCLILVLSTGTALAKEYPEIYDPARLPWNVFGNPVIESGNTVRYTPWFLYYTMQTENEEGWSMGSEGGQVITAVASAPSNPNYLLFSTDVAGSMYSHDGGNTWFKVREGDATWSVSSFIFDPDNENICYAAHGWRGGTGSYTSKANKSAIDGLYKSTDGGVTWKMCLDAAFVNAHAANLLAFDDSKNLYALTTSGVMKSSDGGVKWTNLGSAGTFAYVEAMSVSPDGQKIICAVAGGEAPGLHVSTNGGELWKIITPEAEQSVTAVTMDPVNDSHWVAICNKKLYETFDNGSSWSAMTMDMGASTKNGTPARVEFAKKPSANGIPNLYVRLTNIVYPLRASHDYGKTWITPYVYCEDTLLDNNNGWTQEGMWGDDTNPDVIYAAFWDTLYKSENGGVDFFPCSSGAGNSGLTWVEFAPDGRIWYGFRDKNLAVSNEPYYGGNDFPTVRSIYNYPRRGTAKSAESILADPKDANHLYAFIGGWSGQAMEETFDGGKSWAMVEGCNYDSDNVVFQYHNKDENFIYASGYTSSDNGVTWTPTSRSILAISPADNDVVFSYDETAREAFISFDRGKNWESMGTTSLVASGSSADSVDKNTLYIGTQSHAMVKFTYGQTPETIVFEPKYNGHTDIVTDIAFDPKNPDHMLIGFRNSAAGSKSIGLLESYDHGQNFHVVTGLPGLRYVTDIHFEPFSNRAWIGTYGGTFIYEPDNFKKFLEERITVILNGTRLYFDVDPETVNDRTFVPMRKIFEELGATVSWDDPTQTVTAVKGNKTIKLTIGSTTAYVNDKEMTLDAAPYVTCDRTLVPIRFVTESLNGKVDWTEETKTVTLKAEVTEKAAEADENGVYSFFPTDDTYIYYDKLPYDTDYGANSSMYIKNYSGLNRSAEGYLMFDISDVKGEIESATLSLKVKKRYTEEEQNLGIYEVEFDKWTEVSAAKNEKLVYSIPHSAEYSDRTQRIIPFGNLIGQYLLSGTETPLMTFDVTDYIIKEYKGDKVVSIGIAITENNAKILELYTKEIDNPKNRPTLSIKVKQ